MALREPALRTDDESVGVLVVRAGTDVARIVRAEIGLVQLRVTAALSLVKAASTLLTVGALLALVGIGALVAAIVMVIAQFIPAWQAALIVGGGFAIIGSVIVIVQARLLSRGVTEVLRAPVEEFVHGE